MNLRLLLLLLPGACASAPPAPAPDAAMVTQAPRLEPAPRPFVHAVHRAGSPGAMEMPPPPKMPLGTGAVPVGGGVARGSVTTGFREAF